jgi:glycosyltransferase involved in cell wall biosynthesis
MQVPYSLQANKKYESLSFTWHGDITSISSTAQHAREMLKPLIEGGANVCLQPIKTGRAQLQLNTWWNEALKKHTQSPPGLVHINATAPHSGIANPTGGPTILYTHWETQEQPPVTWFNDLCSNKYTEVWTTTDSLAKQLSFLGKDARVLPYILPKEFNDFNKVAKIHDVNDKTFVFGYTGMWNNRKNISDLIIAYLGQFSKADKVALVIKTNGGNPYDPNERTKIDNLVRDIKRQFNKHDQPPIVLLHDIFSETAMDSIIRRFDCFVSPSRGDARNITMIKSICNGTPCIYLDTLASKDIAVKVNNYLGYDSKHLYPINGFLEPVMQMGNYYPASSRWMRPNVGMMMDTMSKVHLKSILESNSKDLKELKKAGQKVFSINALPKLIEASQPFAVQRM